MRVDGNTITLSDAAGFSFVELMVAATLMAMVLGGVLGLLTSGQNTFEAQSADISMRQGARVAVDRITRETRLAGYSVDNIPQIFTIASATAIQFAADIDDGSAAAPCDATFETATNGGAERITYSVIDTALTRSVDCWDGTSWTVEVASQALVWNLVPGQTVFSFFDEDGNPLTGTLTSAQRDSIRSVAIRIDLEDDSYNHIGTREHTAYELSSQVEIHNLQ